MSINYYRAVLSYVYAVHCVHMTHVMIMGVFTQIVLLCLVSLIT